MNTNSLANISELSGLLDKTVQNASRGSGIRGGRGGRGAVSEWKKDTWRSDFGARTGGLGPYRGRNLGGVSSAPRGGQRPGLRSNTDVVRSVTPDAEMSFARNTRKSGGDPSVLSPPTRELAPSSLSTPGQQAFGSTGRSDMSSYPSSPETLPIEVTKPSENADSRPSRSPQDVGTTSRPSSAFGRRNRTTEEQLSRNVKSKLNKMTVEKFHRIAEQLCEIVEEITDPNKLSEVLAMVLEKAVTEPDNSEMYADLVYCLKMRCSPLLDRDGGEKTFNKVLLTKVEEEFNRMPRTLELSEEDKASLSLEDQEAKLGAMRTQTRGLTVIIGELFVRKMLYAKVLNHILNSLMYTESFLSGEHPPEHSVESACQLITIVGSHLDQTAGPEFLDQRMMRLKELQEHAEYSKRLQCVVQDLVETREKMWYRKVHRDVAKTLAKIKEDQERAELIGGSHVAAQYGYIVRLGERKNLIDEKSEYAQYITEQERICAEKQHKVAEIRAVDGKIDSKSNV